jgi:histone acetyltransferase (RNA polymerase elongator complex component)
MTTDRAGALPSVVHIRARVVSFLKTIAGRSQRREVAFYGGTFTALPVRDQQALLRGVRPFLRQRLIDSIRVSTRPDAIDTSRLDFLRRQGVQTVEIGAQSMIDTVLQNCQRGHTSRDVVESVTRARSMGFEVGVQIMLGLPGEDDDMSLTSVRRVVDLSPDFVRIYPLLVMKGSNLERGYQKGLFVPLSLENAIEWTKRALGLFEEARIPVIRVGLQSTPMLETSGTVLAGPYHPAFRSLVESSIFYDMACRLLGDADRTRRLEVQFRVSPQDLSNLAGVRKGNLARLKKTYGLKSIDIFSDPGIPRGRIALEHDGNISVLSRGDLMDKGIRLSRAP